MDDRKKIEGCVLRAVDRVNELLQDGTLPKSLDAVLLGDGSHLDSMGFINFIVAVEDELTATMGLTVNLTEDLATESSLQPLTIANVIEFIVKRYRSS